jgi:hypothetical protein
MVGIGGYTATGVAADTEAVVSGDSCTETVAAVVGIGCILILRLGRRWRRL